MGSYHSDERRYKTDWTTLRGRQVVIWPDHDAAGAAFAEEVASLLHIAGAASTRIVDVPEHWPEKWDLGDLNLPRIGGHLC